MASNSDSSVTGRISGIIDSVIDNMVELIGPLSAEEVSRIRGSLAWEISETLISRLHNTNFIGHGRVEDDNGE